MDLSLLRQTANVRVSADVGYVYFTHEPFVSDRILPAIRFRLHRIESSSDYVFVIDVHFGWCRPDRMMMRVIVRMQKVVENVQVASHIRVSEIAKHFRLRVLWNRSTTAAFRSLFSLV